MTWSLHHEDLDEVSARETYIRLKQVLYLPLNFTAQVLSTLGRAQHERSVRRHVVLDSDFWIHCHKVVLVPPEQAWQIVRLTWVRLLIDDDKGFIETQS